MLTQNLFTRSISGASRMAVVTRWLRLALLLVASGIPAYANAVTCGATERWFVKVGTDPDAGLVDLNTIVPTTVEKLNALDKLQPSVPHGNNTFRLEQERVVYQVSGRLVLFKDEDDNDYHLVITDDSLEFSPGGNGSDGLETGTSFIAEIPDPDCVAGKRGDPSVPSRFAAQLQQVRDAFEARFPGGAGADKDLHGIPVTLTGVAFYDRPHRQTGRALNGIELHPLLSIQFDGNAPVIPLGGGPVEPEEGADIRQLLANPGFEDGTTGWSGTVSHIGHFPGSTPRHGQQLAALGGRGQAHSESLFQNVTIPEHVTGLKLSLAIRIRTEETTSTTALDKLFVQIRDEDDHVIETLARFSNLDKSDNYSQKAFPLSDFAGRDIQVFFRLTEDDGKATTVSLDDITLTFD
jgi:hypothetical protein